MKTTAIALILSGLAVAPAAFAAETTQPVQAVADAVSAPEIRKGQMIYTNTGRRLANIYRVTPEGDAQIIIQSRMVTVPTAILSEADGKLVADVATSRELLNLK